MAGIDSFTVLMLHMDGADTSTTFTDSSDSAHTMTNVGCEMDTAQSVFGGASGLFSYGTDYLQVPDSTDFDFGTGDFSIDFRVRSTAWQDERMYGVGTYNSAGMCMYKANGSNLRIYLNSASPAYDVAWSPSNDTWYHIAVTRSGTSLRVFIDGTQLGTTVTDSTDISTTDGMFIGAWNIVTSGDTFGGWFDEYRVSKGIARWTADFTPPTEAYSSGSGAFPSRMSLMGIG